MTYEDTIDKMIRYYTSKPFETEVQEARREFFENAGVLDETADNFEQRMSQFLEWYLFSRDLRDNQVPPVVDAFRVAEIDWDNDEIVTVKNLVNHRHSLFDFVKQKDNIVTVKDLFNDEKITVKNCPWIFGFDKKAIFEARLIPDDQMYCFTRGICFHPVEARKFILNEIKECRNSDLQDRRRLMLQLMKLRYKFENYNNINFRQIYSEESKLRV